MPAVFQGGSPELYILCQVVEFTGVHYNRVKQEGFPVVFRKVDDAQPVIRYLTEIIQSHLSAGERVTWIVTGGSAISIAAMVSQNLATTDTSRLSITLTDERYGLPGHADSNWQQLLNGGFSLPNAHLYPVLRGKELIDTVDDYREILRQVIEEADYTIGLFGIGPDGHIASLFPGYPALNEAASYAVIVENSPKPPPLRISMSPVAVRAVDEAVMYIAGPDKTEVITSLRTPKPSSEQPAQLLKQIPTSIIFNDQIEEDI